MLTELVVATLVVLASVLTHGFGLFTISNVLGLEGEDRRAIGMASPRAVGRLLAVLLMGWSTAFLVTLVLRWGRD